MKEFTVPMALLDYVPVIFFGIAVIILQRDLYNKMSKGAFALFAAGTIDVLFAGVLKATYKLLYALGVCDFDALNVMFMPLQSIGFLLAGLGIIAMFSHKQGMTSAAVVAPTVFKGTFLFVGMMIAGIGCIDAGLIILARKMKKKGAIVCFVLSFIFILGMGYLSSKDFSKGYMNYIAEVENMIGQAILLTGTLILHKAGLENLTIEKQ